MSEILCHLFAFVCGQNPDHTWSPGGWWLPCCQRCTGLYAAAAIAALLHAWLRPRLSGRFLEIHGAFFLLAAPFCLHWVPQAAILRTMSGVLFGFGVVTFLWLPLSESRRSPDRAELLLGESDNLGGRGRRTSSALRSPMRAYFVVFGATMVLVPLTAMLGGGFGAYALSGIVFAGSLALLALGVTNVCLAALGIVRILRKCFRRRNRLRTLFPAPEV